MRRGLVVVCLAGCDAIFGVKTTVLIDAALPRLPDADTRADLDHDGIADVDDPCIASRTDAITDYDGDMIPNLTDACPFDPTANSPPDGDGDGIPDICDPFPAATGDDKRCAMLFRDSDLNLALWQPRPGDPAWDVVDGAGLRGLADGTLLASENIEPPDVATYDIYAQLTEHQFPSSGAARIWVSTTIEGSPDDVGCEVSGDDTHVQLAIVGPNAPPAMTANISAFNIFRLQITVEPAVPSLRCKILVYSFSGNQMLDLVGAVPVLPGMFGATEINSMLDLVGVTFYHRSDPQPLP